MVRINPGPVKLSLFVYLISHIFAQGNYILLILYSRGPQVNTIFWDFPLDIETWTWPRTFPTFHPFHRSTAHTDRCRIEIIIIIIKKKNSCHTFKYKWLAWSCFLQSVTQNSHNTVLPMFFYRILFNILGKKQTTSSQQHSFAAGNLSKHFLSYIISVGTDIVIN